MGRPFEAVSSWGGKETAIDFGETALMPNKRSTTEKHEALGLCPVPLPQGQVYVFKDRSCACEQCITTPRHAPFAISKNILHREIPKEQCRNSLRQEKRSPAQIYFQKGRAFLLT